ncbi:MAG: hypothetical protein ACI8TX_000118 [Hyphomicrobiaceae bacterium]|jgi:hypothetical protein
MADKILRIGGASGFWGESAMATPQLLAVGNLDVIVYDYLAEITMSILARARAKDPAAGYATDFVTAAMKPNLAEIARQKVKVVSNAGGVNPDACAAALRKLISDAGLDLVVAVVRGDDLMSHSAELASQAPLEMFNGSAFPDPAKLASINAYLGAFPIAEALGRGADIVITGRCVDSAVTLGACIHSFGWKREDFDKLAGGSLAGHILECGPQATGGNFTDWEEVASSIHEIGYPIAEVTGDGSFVCTKPQGTGGKVSVGTVGEQMLYEIGDPQAYILPDVVCDFSAVSLDDEGNDRVRVSGALGRPAPDTYKVCATWFDGFRGGILISFYGGAADRKARVFAEAVLMRARKTLADFGQPDYTETSIEILGCESQYGSARRQEGSREVVLKLAAKHPEALAIGLLLREMTGLALATPPGLSGFAGSRPKPSPVVRLFSFLLPKNRVEIDVDVAGDTARVAAESGVALDRDAIVRAPEPERPVLGADTVEVPLVSLAWGRSGDKGNHANIGILARKPEYFPYIWAAVTEEVVAERFAHFDVKQVERFQLPGTRAMNFLLHDVLGGGGIASLRNDSQGKGYGQLLLDARVPVPRAIAESLP